MTAPETSAGAPGKASGPDSPVGMPQQIRVLKKRADFLRAARAKRAPMPGFILQARPRGSADDAVIGIGFTCSKKVGNAVARNRAKRRLREIARAVLPFRGHPGWDYVLIGRNTTTASLPFDQLLADLDRALSRIHRA